MATTIKIIRACALGAAIMSLEAFADKSREADNSGINRRDRKSKELTADQQSRGTGDDVETTRRIRAALLDDEKLSVYAQNIKIITINGKVTLRGPVESESEKDRIASIAKNVIGDSRRITNKLEITR